MKVIVEIDGKDINELTEEERIRLSEELNAQALETSGYRAVEKYNKKTFMCDFLENI